MKKSIVVGITNDEELVWYRIKPDSLVVSHIDAIVRFLDAEYKEGIAYPDEKKTYKDFIPARFSHKKNGKIYAISIFNEDLVDFIVFKNNSVFKQVSALIDKHFEFANLKK